MKQIVELRPTELWIVQVLKAASSWVSAEKIAAVLCALKLSYPMPGLSFELRNGTLRSPEVEEALRRLVTLELVEEHSGAFRLTKRGYKLAEKVLSNSSWTLPYADVVFYLAWDVNQLVQHVSKSAAASASAK